MQAAETTCVRSIRFQTVSFMKLTFLALPPALTALLAVGLPTLLVSSSSRPAAAAPQAAQGANAFVNSIGVAVPIQSAVPDAARSVANEALVAARWEKIFFPRLQELGVRFIRSDIDTHNLASEARIKRLGAMGVVTQGIFDPRGTNWTGHTPAQAVAMLKRVGPHNMLVEGPNEPDLHNPNYAFVFNGKAVPDDPSGIRDYQKALYQAIKTDPATKNVRVVMSSVGHLPKGGEDIIEFADVLNGHFYTPGTAPGSRHDLKKWRQTFGLKPLFVTETGDHTAVYKTDGLWQPGLTEDVQAKNTVRIPFYWFSQGVQRTYIFNFSDGPDPFNSQHNFGMVRFDNTPKPGFTALKNVIVLLKDPGPDFPAQPLDYSLAGDQTNVMSVLLQKRDGRHYLALWQNINSFDPQGLKMVENPTKTITVAVNAPVAGANVYAPTTNGTTAIQAIKGKTFVVEVPDHPVILEMALTPQQLAKVTKPLLAQVPGVRAPTAPTGMAALRPIAGNEVANYGFETGALQPWNDFGTESKVVSEPVYGGTRAVEIGAGDGKGGVNIGVALKPSTKYVLRATTKLSQPGQSARITAAPSGMPRVNETFSHTDYAPVTVEFTTGTDGSTQIFFWKDGGQGSAFGDNFILTTPDQLKSVEAAIAAQELKPVGLNAVSKVEAPTAPLVAPPVTGGTKNFLADGGFESGALGAWQDFGTGSKAVKEDAQGGAYVAQIGVNGGKGGISLQVTGLTPNTAYEWRGFAKIERAGEQARVTAKDFGGKDATILIKTTDYAPFVVPFMTGPNTSGARLIFWRDAGTGAAWGDDFELLAVAQ